MVYIDLKDTFLQVSYIWTVTSVSVLSLWIISFQSKALVQSRYSSSGLRTGHGSGLSHSASPGYSHGQITG